MSRLKGPKALHHAIENLDILSFRLAELQADDFHLDRALFFACREDREKFCEKTRAGEGRVYKCLMKYKMERGMSKEVKEAIATTNVFHLHHVTHIITPVYLSDWIIIIP